MPRLGRSILVGFLLGAFASTSNSQQISSQPPVTDLGIEIVGNDHPRAYPLGRLDIAAPPARPDWSQPKETAPLTRIRVESKSQGGVAIISIRAVFDDSLPVDAPGPKYGEKEEMIANYSASLNETITVRELEKYGVEPLRLRVIEYKESPATKPETGILPRVVSRVESLAFVDVKNEKSGDALLTIQNVGTKSVFGLAIERESGRDQMTPGKGKSLILPGATFQVATSTYSSRVIGSEQADDAGPEIVVSSALFEDGSYEGDVAQAAEMAAREAGRQIQLERLMLILQGASVKASDVSVIQQLKNDVEGFRIDVDPSLVKELQSQFPLLAKAKKDDRVWLTSMIMEGLKYGRQHSLSLLKQLEVQRAAGVSLQESIPALQERLAGGLRRH